MANPHRGEVGFTADGKEWTLKWGTEAMCLAEDETGLTVGQISSALSDPERVSIKMLRAVVWASLKGHHSDVTLQDASAVIDDLGGEAVGELLSKATKLAEPVAKNGGDARPRKAAAR